MTILNMTYGQGNPYQPFHLNAISDLSATPGNGQATITWTDPGDLVVDGQTLATWSSTKLVRKIGSAPSDSSDGTLVVEETVADTYSVSGYTDTGLTNGTTYYYGAFATATNGLETISNIVDVTPDNKWHPGANTVLYCPLDTDINDATGNHTMTLQTSSYGGVAKDSTGYYFFDGGYITSENYTGPDEVTVSMWLKKETKHISEAWCWAFSGHYRNGNPYHYFAIDTGNSDNTHNAEFIIYNGSAGSVTTNAITEGVWTHVALTYSATTGLVAYVNGVSVGTYATTGNITSYNGPTNIGATFAYTNQFYEGYISEVIIESVPRTAQEISDYFDLTKGDYGIS